MPHNIRIGKWMIRDVLIVPETTTVREGAEIMQRQAIGSLLIGEPQKPDGICTDRDLVRAVAEGRDPAATPLRDCMTSKLIYLEAGSTFQESLLQMVGNHIRHAPVREDGKLVGIVSARDMLRLQYEILEESYRETARELGKTQRMLEQDSDERFLELLRLNEELEARAITDGLTGLYNHRYFQDRLKDEIARSRRYQYPVSLIFIDVDHFKQYNDANGHLMGDYVLKTIATLLQQAGEDGGQIPSRLRKTDIVARYGGEEFVIILPYAGQQDSALLADRIRNLIAEYPFNGRNTQPDGLITVSLGVSCFPTPAGSREELIVMADRALYEAKETGRNQVRFSG